MVHANGSGLRETANVVQPFEDVSEGEEGEDVFMFGFGVRS